MYKSLFWMITIQRDLIYVIITRLYYSRLIRLLIIYICQEKLIPPKLHLANLVRQNEKREGPVEWNSV